ALAAESGIKNAADGQRVVTDKFGIKALPRTAGEKTIFAVTREPRGGRFRRLPVGGAEHDLFDGTFGVPIAHEVGGEPVEQLRVAGPLALRAEVVEGLHQAGAKE